MDTDLLNAALRTRGIPVARNVTVRTGDEARAAVVLAFEHELLERLIELALERHESGGALRY